MAPHLTAIRHAAISRRIDDDLMKRSLFTTNQGFTLVELMAALVVAGLIALVTATVLIQNAESNARAESRRRLLEDWNRATNLLQDEIAMSQTVLSEGDDEPIRLSTDGCDWLDSNDANLKLQMHLPGTLPDVIYGIRSIASLEADDPSQRNQWIGGPDAGVLIRCGPELLVNPDGSTSYNQGGPYQQSVMVDDLDITNNNGLKISKEKTPQGDVNHKLINFELALKGDFQNISSESNSSFRLGSSGLSRINDVPPIPGEQSVCEKVCQQLGEPCSGAVTTIIGPPRDYIVDEISFGTATYCTNREVEQFDKVRGVNNNNIYIEGNYVLDGNPTPNRQNGSFGIELLGGEGRNVLLGTPLNDTIQGGPSHDALIGRGGNDTLRGFEGDDSFIPFSTNSEDSNVIKAYGGGGFDRVYMQKNKSDYVIKNNCNTTKCVVNNSGGGASARLFEMEQLVFKDETCKVPDC